MDLKKRLCFIVFLLCIEVMSFAEVVVYQNSNSDGYSLKLFGNNITVISEKLNEIEIEGNLISIKYTKGSVSGNDSGYSTVLYIDREEIRQKVYENDKKITSDFTIKVIKDGNSKGGPWQEPIFEKRIKVRNLCPDISFNTYYITKNQIDELIQRYETITNFETLRSLKGTTYGKYFINVSVLSGHLYQYSLNGIPTIYAAPGTKLKFEILNENSSTSNSFSRTELYVNDVSFLKDEYIFPNEKDKEINFEWKHFYGGGGGGVDANGNSYSSSTNNSEVLWSCRIKIGQTGLNDETDLLENFSSESWVQLQDKEILLKAVSTDSSGIKKIVSNNSDYFIGEKGVLYTVVNGYETVTITAENEVGLKTSKSITFYIDNDSPEIGYTIKKDDLEGYSGEWVNKEVLVTVEATDNISGIKKTEYKIDSGSWTELTGNMISVAENGTHKISLRSEDNAGNVSEIKELTVKIDREKPVIEEVLPELIFDSTKGTIKGVKAKVTAGDENSGIDNSSYDVRIYVNDKYQTLKRTGNDSDTWEGEFSDFSRNESKKVYVSVQVKDNACNLSEVYKTEVAIIPAKKAPKVTESIYIEEKKEIETKIKVYPETTAENGLTVTYYYTRDLYNGGKIIDGAENFRSIPLYKNEDVKLYETFISEQKLSFKNAGNEVSITDRIDIKSGFGHKTVQYMFSQEFEAWGKSYREKLDSTNTKTEIANCSPEIRLVIEGIEEDGSIRCEFIDMKDIRKDLKLKLPKSGVVNMGVQIFDYDIEEYKVELSQVKDIKFTDSVGKKEMHIPEAGAIINGQTVYAGADRKRVFKSDTLNKEKEYNLFPNPILLNFNTYTKYVLSVKESSDEERDTDAVVFYTEYSENGLVLKVEDGDYNANGITAQVYSVVKFNVKNEDESSGSFTWDFGDGTKKNDDSETSHTYQQAADRKDGESLYKLKIQNDKGNEAEINVHIMDTEYGPMKGNEKWVGKHFVRGEVIVPDKTILTLGAEDLEAPAPIILSYGAQNKEKRGKITVCTGGVITSENKGNVIFSEMKNTAKGFIEIEDESEHSGWGGITAETGSKVTLKNCEIRYAEKALSVTGIGTDVNLEGVYIHNNNVGIHILNGAEAKIWNSEIRGNRIYGIKEDGENVKTSIQNSVIKMNGTTESPRDYYKSGVTLSETEQQGRE